MMALYELPGMKSVFDATMLTSVDQHSPVDVTQVKMAFVSTQSAATQPYPLSPSPPHPHTHPPVGHPHPHPPQSDSASGFAAGDVAKRQLIPAQSLSGDLGGKVIADPADGKNHVVWAVSDSHLDKQQVVGKPERKKKLAGRPLLSPFKRILTRDKRQSATEIRIRTHADAATPKPTSAEQFSQPLDGQHLLHLVRTNDDLTQQLIAKSNTVLNLEATVTELKIALDQLRIEVERGRTRETNRTDEVRILQETLAKQEKDADAKCKDHEAEVARLTEQLESLTKENQDLRTSKKQSTSDQNYSKERLIQDLQSTVDELQDQVNFFSTERDSFKKSFANAKLDAAQNREELREKIVDLLDRQRDITSSIRNGLPLGRIALKRALQKTEKFLVVKAQKQKLQQKVDFLSNKSFVQDLYIDDLRQIVCEMARTLVEHQLTPGYSLSHALDRLNMPFDEVVQMPAIPFRWETMDETSSNDSSMADTDAEFRSNASDYSGSDYPEESAAKWRKRKKKRKKKKEESPQRKEELSSDVSGSEKDAASIKDISTARYRRRLTNKRT